MSRFDYVQYDPESILAQAEFKNLFTSIEVFANKTLKDSRPKSLLMTALEEAYMWTGKAIRDQQISRVSLIADLPERSNE
jgi:hypothetical protein